MTTQADVALADLARERYPEYLSPDELKALDRRQVRYSVAIEMVCQEMQCGVTSFYKHYRKILHPFPMGGENSALFCWEEEVLRAIARVKQTS